MKSDKLLYICSFIAVSVIFHLCYGLKILIPTNISWLLTVMHDWGGHYIGWYFYRFEDWQFPLGEISRLIHPVGTNVGFTDSIPVFAVFFKIFSSLLPEDFQYFGFWLFFSHLLTAFFTIKVLKLFKVKPFYIFIVVVFIVANPVLIYRGMHPALTAHWLLIASLYLYFIKSDFNNRYKILYFQLILLLISSWVSPYLAAMILGFNFIIGIKLGFFDKVINYKVVVIYIIVTLVSLIASWYFLGLITFTGNTELSVADAYGLYSLNLNALFNSFGFSAIIPQLKWVSPHQYEGFSYPGIGILFLFAIAIAYAVSNAIFKKVDSSCFNYLRINNTNIIPLIVLVICYTIFALTHSITFNDKVLLAINIPQPLMEFGNIFRASSRFFWIVYYLIILFTLITIAKAKIHQGIKITVLIIALAVQFYDLQLMFNYRNLTYGSYKPPIDENNWMQIIKSFDEVVLYPPYQPHYMEEMDHQYFCFLAAKARKPVSNGYVPRTDFKKQSAFTETLNNNILDGEISEKILIITTEDQLKYFATLAITNAIKINVLDGYYYLYSSNINDPTLIDLSNSLNKRDHEKLNAAIARISYKSIFKESETVVSYSESEIKYNIELFKEKKGFLNIGGWAFLNGKDNNKDDSIFILLKSDSKTYIAKLNQLQRSDVTAHFKKTYLDDAGFVGTVFYDNLKRGMYNVGFAIKTADGKIICQLTEKNIRIGDEYVQPRLVNKNIPEGDIRGWFDKVEVNEEFIIVSGWGFFNYKTMDDIELQLILKKGSEFYFCYTDPVLRPDLTPYFNSKFNLDKAGFTCKILKGAMANGDYQLGIYLKDNVSNTEGIFMSDKFMKI